MILTKVRARNAVMLILVGMTLSVPPNAHAQRVANDVSTVDSGGLPTPDEIASHVQTVATPKAIIDRILSANQNAPRIATMDFVANLRVRRPLSAPPDCVFEGAVKLEAGHRSATINHLTPGLLCIAVNRTIISKLFEGNEPFATLLARFDFQVLGEKVVNGGQSYLVQGKARESQADPKAMIGWIDYDRGLVIEATMYYAARTIDLAQHYTSVNDAWVLTYQYVNIPSLGSTVEISYSKITRASVPVSRVPSEQNRSLSAVLLTLVAPNRTAARNLRDNRPLKARNGASYP
jgi:hypothetical protein